MKKIFAFLLILNTSALAAQKNTTEIGPEFKIQKNRFFTSHLHSDVSGHYIVLEEQYAKMLFYTQIPVLQKYDRKYNLVFEKKLKIGDDSNIIFDEILYAKENFMLCSHQSDKKEDKYYCYAAKVDKQGKESVPQKIATVSYNSKNDKPTYVKWLISNDTTRIANAIVADHDEKDIGAKILLTVTDNNLNKIWSKGFVMPYSQKQLLMSSWSVTNDGKVYLIGKVYDENNYKESKNIDGKKYPAYKVIVFGFDDFNDKPKEYVIELGDKYVTGINLKLSPKNDLNLVGFYTTKTRGAIQGVLYTRINGNTGTTEVATQQEFDVKDVANLDTEKDRSGDEGLDANFKFCEIMLREDGSLVVSAEDTYTYTFTSGAGRDSRNTIDYHYNEIFVTSISVEGQIEWMRVVPKKQKSVNINLFSGFVSIMDGEKVHFVYNDDEYNISSPIDAKPIRLSDFRTAKTCLFTINRDGTMKRSAGFVDVKKDKYTLLVPSFSKQIGSGELFFVTNKFAIPGKTRMRLGVIKVP